MRRGALSLTALAVALLALPATTRADSLEEIFDRANHAYFQGDYEGAADGYRELHGLAAGPDRHKVGDCAVLVCGLLADH